MNSWQLLAGRISFALAILIAVSIAALVALGLVFWFKARRDRAERRSRSLRTGLIRALEEADAATLTALTSRIRKQHHSDQADLLAVVSTTMKAPWWTEATTSALSTALGGQTFVRGLERQASARSPARRGTAMLLGAHASCSVPVRLIASHLTDRETTVRLAAAAALERAATDETAEALVDALEQDLLPVPRIIERLGHPWAVSVGRARLHTIDTGRAPTARASLARALGLAGQRKAIPDLLWLLEVGDLEETIQAMRALAECANNAKREQRAAIAAAARACLTSSTGPLTLMATRALATTGEHEDIPLFASLVGDANWHVRRAAAHSLVRFGQEGIDQLTAIASGDDAFAADRAREQLDMERGGDDEH